MFQVRKPIFQFYSHNLRAGFTLVELLTVIAILGILAAILFSVLGNVVEKSRSIQCLSNLRQFGVAAHMYADDNAGRLPSSSHHREEDGSSLSWTETLETYLGPDFIGRCPSVPDHPARITYALNDLLTESGDGAGIPLTFCRDPALTLLVGEIAPSQSTEHFHFRGASRGRVSPAMFSSSVHVEGHGSGANYLFVDAHVEALGWPDVQRRLNESEQTFLQP
jgi:prepilin-type N-terminal cleavage/methylation domain-containing protein/prepilin-type processing-associated H-X9-DG protein